MNKKIIISIAIAVIIIATGAIGFFYYKDNGMSLSKKLEQKQSQEQTINAEIPTRDKIEQEYTWDLSVVYNSDEDWEQDFEKLETEYLPLFADFIGKLDNPNQAIKCLKLLDEAAQFAEKLFYFAFNTSNQDLFNSQNSERLARAKTLFSKFNEKIAFIDSELIEIPKQDLESYISNPVFADHKHYLDVLLDKKEHVLTKEQEEILAKSYDMSSSFSNIFSKLNYVDIEFPVIKDENNQDYQLSEARYLTVLANKDRDFRKRAYKGILGSYVKYASTMAEVLSGKVKKDIFYSDARKYNTSLESFLDNDLIDEEIYNNLISSTNKRTSYLQRYISLKKKALNIESVHQYDLYVPIVEELDIKIPYEQGKEKVLAALAPLGERYINDLNLAFNNRWVDVHETKDKKSGAYSTANYEPHPFVFINYLDNFDDLRCLAHEMGHALNFYYTNDAQPYSKAGMSNFNAEIPSIFNEILVMKYFINNAKTDNEELYYLNNFATAIFSLFYSQVEFSEFELAIHERIEDGQAISAEYLNNLWADNTAKYFGEDYTSDEEVKYTWERISHFYVHDFYVYRYAASMAAANEFADQILNDKPGALDRYYTFLSAGKSDYPLEILKKAGIDMSEEKIYDNLLSDFNNAVIKMEEILTRQGKI